VINLEDGGWKFRILQKVTTSFFAIILFLALTKLIKKRCKEKYLTFGGKRIKKSAK
jgi:hypothetical protein